MAKRFMFEAFDCYVALFYVGFVQQDIRKLRQELMCLYGVDSLRRAGAPKVCFQTGSHVFRCNINSYIMIL